MNIKNNQEIKKRTNFVSIFQFESDKSKPGRTLGTVRIGDVYMTRLVISPGVITGNYYHKRTKIMFYVESGHIQVGFENVKTRERKEMVARPAKQIFHLPPYVSLATKNIGNEDAIIVYFSNKPLRSEDNFTYVVL